METKMIPYQVYLSPDIHKKLKEAAGDRRASGIVRDAINAYFGNTDAISAGYNSAIGDVIDIIAKDKLVSGLTINSNQVDMQLINKILKLKRKENGKKKRGA